MVGDSGDDLFTVRLVSCSNDAGGRLATRPLCRLDGGRGALTKADDPVPDYRAILCPPGCPT